MHPHALTAFLALVATSSSAIAQQCMEDICFIDRGASGEIALGPRFGSVSVIDYDNDGFPDLLVGDRADYLLRLYRNIPDPVRVGHRNFQDVTLGAGFATLAGVGATPPGAFVADFNNDGWSDVYFLGRRVGETNSGRLFRNDAGVFTDVTAASGVSATGDEPESASWIDFDLDGYIDLLVASRQGSAHPLRLLRNQHDGSFADVSTLTLACFMTPPRTGASTPRTRSAPARTRPPPR